MEVFRVDNILKEIEAYDINKDNCIEFLLQSMGRSDNLAYFFYKSSLLQLIQGREHLDKMLAFYYGVDNAYLINEEIAGIYKSFLQGDNKLLYSVFKYADELANDFCKLSGMVEIDLSRLTSNNAFTTISSLLKKLDAYIKYRNSKLNDISLEKEDKEKINLQIQSYNSKIKLIIDRIDAIFRESGSEVLLIVLNLGEVFSEENDVKLGNFYAKFNSCYNFIVQYYKLIEDVLAMTLVIKGYTKIKESILESKSLTGVCLMIRKLLFGENNLAFRQFGLKANSRMMAEATLPKNINNDFEKLSIQFRDCLDEQDGDLFIRKCADFHYDFLRVHPFSDGNGRTARVLLTTMLMSRNIMLPTLYYDYDDKCNFYVTSGTALDGDYRNVEQNLYAVLGRYYPTVMPPIPIDKKTYNENNNGIRITKK